MGRKKNNGNSNANIAVPQSGGAKGGGSSAPVQPPKQQLSVAKSKNSNSLPVAGKTVVRSTQPSAQEIAQMAANLINSSTVHSKKKKKKSFLGKVGSFLEGAFKKAVSIAPMVLSSLANTVHADWQQGSITAEKLKAMAKATPRLALSPILPRVNSTPDDASPDAPCKSCVISKRQVSLNPNIVKQLKDAGVGKVSVLPNQMFSAPSAIGGHLAYGFETMSDKHKKFGNGLRIRGSDYLDDILATGSAIPRGTSVGSFNLNPATWDGTRVAKFAGMYERFIINSLSVVYTPGVGTSTTGSLVGWYDVDPNDTAGDGRDAVVRALSYVGQDNSPVWAGHIAHFQPDPEQPDYYVDPNGSDNRLTSAGTYYCTVMAALPNNTAGSSFGSLSIVYDISYFIPSVQLTVPGVAPEFLLNGGGTMSATNPLGDAATEDSDNTMDLTVDLGTADKIYGFVGSKSTPSSYLYLIDITGTGIGAPVPALTTGLTSNYWAYVVNAGATRVIGYGSFTCQPGVDVDPISVNYQLTVTATTVTASSIRFFRVSSGVTLVHETLQDFERMALDTKKTVDTLMDILAEQKIIDLDKKKKKKEDIALPESLDLSVPSLPSSSVTGVPLDPSGVLTMSTSKLSELERLNRLLASFGSTTGGFGR